MNILSSHSKAIRIPLLILGGVILAAVLALLLGFVVQWLWNWLMPVIFGLGTITFWQAWGLVLLSHILFKTGGVEHHHKHLRKIHESKASEPVNPTEG
ncbi:hypothetical protein JW823_05520 [bacterium]|nr:hypothetical protein [candidate division CSSED10-310 bacterium]